jgi:hypothetical protein
MHPPVLHKDGEIGAEESAQSTVDAMDVLNILGGMVALGVGALRHHQHLLGAELDAEPASFASFLDDMNDAVRYLDAVPI